MEPSMDRLNYHHLLYFYLVAREGSIAKAGKLLRLSEPTISEQIKAFESALGHQLFVRAGRGLRLTEAGQAILPFAERIFTVGAELQDAVRNGRNERTVRLHVGVSGVVPKLIACKLLLPAMRETGARLFCSEDHTERLLAALAIHELDLVVADAPIGPGARIRAYNHVIGESGVTFFAAPGLHARLTAPFPRSLSEVPMLLPAPSTKLRAQLDAWLERQRVRPRIAGEFEDSALMKAFGEQGEGIFPGPTLIESDIQARYGVSVVGRTDRVRETFYAISTERRVTHPAVLAITRAAMVAAG